MHIKRMCADFGNSLSQFMIDGMYFESPSTMVELSSDDVQKVFAEAGEKDSLLDNLCIKVKRDQQERFFKIGKFAKHDTLSNDHILTLHDKTESDTVYLNFLGALAYYHAFTVEAERDSEHEVTVDYFKTLLPIWLLKQGEFAPMLQKMANRFLGQHEVTLLTPSFERTLNITVKKAKCRIEGESARLPLKYNLQLEQLEESKRFENVTVVIVDLGGQTDDLTKCQPGLKRPASSKDFESFTDESYLQTLEDLRKNKLLKYFTSLRELEDFITAHAPTREYILVDPVSGKKTDLTEPIETAIKKFLRIIIKKSMHAFHFESNETVVFVWIGGVSQLHQDYIKEILVELVGPEITRNNHYFPPNARFLNLYALEIVAKQETLIEQGA